jgi:hypothetical protein
MATFSMWLTAWKKNPRAKQVTWIYGPEQVLKDDVVAAIRRTLDVDAWSYLPMVVGEDSERAVWAALDEHPIGLSNRLVVVHHAERLTQWDRLIDWVATRTQNPKTYVVFVSAEERLARTDPPPEERRRGVKEELLPYLAAISGKGPLIECRPFTQATAKHAVSWVRSRLLMREAVAGHLLDRANGDLRLVRDTLFKMRVMGVEPTVTVVNTMLAEQPRDSFVASLMALDKKTALSALQRVPEGDYSRLVGLLDSDIEFANRIHDMLIEQKTQGEIMRAVGNRGFLVSDVIPVAKHYNSKRVMAIRLVLAAIDEHLRQGIRVGLMESLVAQW